MKTITIRDLRQRWPEAEALLETENEILVTRDSKPVARLVRYMEPNRPRKQFDPAVHARWQEKMGGKVRLVEKYLTADRES
ncbi:MAG TPA: type II toxin-antitoxin system Phd/YefM family antitoxin [Verrucomicrobiales bacterium]|jgi:antitoxin (DNA-binding transcriptional repressor) of toxin-antitoxin stability system|nr:type II toxin-antitoxin system Phd/YefM family antitoxin [Verrucomicrobiales bacterium]